MKKGIIWVIVLVIIIGGIALLNKDKEQTIDQSMVTGHPDVTVTPISHATMVVDWADYTMYTDPVGGVEAFATHPTPDIVLMTDIHGDHLSVETLQGVVGEDTVIIAPQAVLDELTPDLAAQTVVMANGDTTEQLGFAIEAMPMYNLPESDDAPHVRGRGNGYILERNDVRLYVAGDTAGIPEMRSLENITIAFVPMNLPYTMDVAEAADAVIEFAPEYVYPYHYRGPDGLSDVAEFQRLVTEANSDITVVLLDWYPESPASDTTEEPAVDSEDQDTLDEEDAVGQTDNTMGSDFVQFDLTGKSFEYSQDEIRVKLGDMVRIDFTSTGGFHDWVVDEFDAATDKVNEGETTSVTFLADQVGSFEYYCSVGSHRAQGMVGTLIVEG